MQVKVLSIILSLCILSVSTAGLLDLHTSGNQVETSCCQALPLDCCDHSGEEDEQGKHGCDSGEDACGPECQCHNIMQVQALVVDSKDKHQPVYHVLSYPTLHEHYHLDLVHLLLQPPRFA